MKIGRVSDQLIPEQSVDGPKANSVSAAHAGLRQREAIAEGKV